MPKGNFYLIFLFFKQFFPSNEQKSLKRIYFGHFKMYARNLKKQILQKK